MNYEKTLYSSYYFSIDIQKAPEDYQKNYQRLQCIYFPYPQAI